MADELRRACSSCGADCVGDVCICPVCGLDLDAGRRMRAPYRFPWGALLDAALRSLLPFLGPLLQYLSDSGRSDFTELASVLLWPALYVVIGLYVLSLHRASLWKSSDRTPRATRLLEWYRSLSIAGLVFFALFEAGMVIAISTWRWNPHERDIAVGIFKFCAGSYGMYLLMSLLAAFAARAALRRGPGSAEELE